MNDANGFVKCAHCAGTGTCKNGQNETSCLVCIKEQKVKIIDSTFGIVCSVCHGVGITEPKSVRLHNRIVPVLAMMIVYVALFLVMILSTREHFSEVLAFAATLIGSVTGYYFGGKAKK
ncbi:hypothetical protein Gbem_4144 [Citrifermentans bemidjiense Bem]|uniref:Molecular chaperone DnaJ n=1 Tax=Citrifermentans bemidjiense (strain ATCC BAA-1014 / DSM 16622 / JCM 12645 / Bem) TaxID=404380 RepID=E1P6E9_CITBB|nr:hypothetical protein [Citrifermentans bemidjiense]ADO00844.1 hypothetical protein Gbem_4144 [Citrifermentans bemidjiense Bem]